MLYVNKSTKEVVELLFSDHRMCVYIASVLKVDIEDSDDDVVGQGIVFKGNKKTFKRFFKKASHKVSDSHKELDEDAKSEIYAICVGDSYGLLNHTAEYIEGNKKLEIKEFHENQTEEEREQMLLDLAD